MKYCAAAPTRIKTHAEKVARLQSMMAPFSGLVPEVFRSPVSHYRMRAEFRLWHDGD
ncbi:hypothetical protein MJO10_29165, partial [Salmonella enterica subsp. enterica serovar Anatum]|nr:hypothetical protein [Salmonella enterica subsp. enterica serovar Anatum]